MLQAGLTTSPVMRKYNLNEAFYSGAHGHRYHLPAHVREHVDYITPGIRLFATRGGRTQGGGSDLEKRTFGVTSKKPGKQPPIMKPLPMALSSILAMAESAICDVAITPQCIASKLVHDHEVRIARY